QHVWKANRRKRPLPVLKNTLFRECVDEAKRTHDRTAGPGRELRCSLIVASRSGQIGFRNSWSEENLQHPLVQIRKELWRSGTEFRRTNLLFRMPCGAERFEAMA